MIKADLSGGTSQGDEHARRVLEHLGERLLFCGTLFVLISVVVSVWNECEVTSEFLSVFCFSAVLDARTKTISKN